MKYKTLREFEDAIKTALERNGCIPIINETYSKYLKIEYIDSYGNNCRNRINYKKNNDCSISLLEYEYNKEILDSNYFYDYFKQKISQYKNTCTSLIILEYKPLSENFIKTAIINDEEKIKEIFKEINYKEIVKINPGKTEINIHINSEYFNKLVLDKNIKYYTYTLFL